ncbi:MULTISPECIES: hypothetical protein [unclassified Meiothermus]|uniref:DUF6414 family protein n=1 Tax=unclassified Meiothermus TaxID=370471 RepID=UPI000D7BCC57|nr:MULTISPECIES: hypothetical protein [unclassified Meiothermus]PZA08616.1 hypothetical protein DNA98_00770 [Meiothermus sp. Pnk-1]RYM40766.1 hypothetical protein EWH23_01170 [Meiothermus sp. PNK-Is4]
MSSAFDLFGSDSGVLKHFLYLDDYRVASYISQFNGGYTFLKQLREFSADATQDVPLGYEKETKIEQKASGKAGAGVLGVEGERAQSETTKLVRGGQTRYQAASTGLDEIRVAHDNLYLDLEAELLKRKLIRSADVQLSPGIVSCTGFGRFVELAPVLELFQHPEDLAPLFEGELAKTFKSMTKNGKAFARFFKATAFTPLTLVVHTKTRTIAAPLNLTHLRLTLEQLRAGYAGDQLITLVGYLPQKSVEPRNINLFADINLGALLPTIIGEFDAIIEPLAIYIEQPIE